MNNQNIGDQRSLPDKPLRFENARGVTLEEHPQDAYHGARLDDQAQLAAYVGQLESLLRAALPYLVCNRFDVSAPYSDCDCRGCEVSRGIIRVLNLNFLEELFRR